MGARRLHEIMLAILQQPRRHDERLWSHYQRRTLEGHTHLRNNHHATTDAWDSLAGTVVYSFDRHRPSLHRIRHYSYTPMLSGGRQECTFCSRCFQATKASRSNIDRAHALEFQQAFGLAGTRHGVVSEVQIKSPRCCW